MSGMKPKWYAVVHLNDGNNSKRQQTRRLDIDEVTNGLTYGVEKLKEFPITGHITLKRGERSELATLAAKKL